jgi:hypothetical protein
MLIRPPSQSASSLSASNSCFRRFLVIDVARWISSRASVNFPIDEDVRLQALGTRDRRLTAPKQHVILPNHLGACAIGLGQEYHQLLREMIGI